MEKVVTINLNGNPYQLDETAYAALSGYLAETAEALKNNPDRDEIIADIEQAIADKCLGFIGPGRSVISKTEMDRALEEMGPVEDDSVAARSESESATAEESGAAYEGASSSSSSSAAGERPKRIYRVPTGAMIAGVCNGIASYFNIDPAIVRLLFIGAAIITHGWAVIAYLVLMFVIPAPHTPEQWAAAHNAPFNAQEVIDRAKREYQDFADRGGFKDWPKPKSARRAARRARRAARRTARYASRAASQAASEAAWAGASAWSAPGGYAPVGPIGSIVRAIAGLFAFVFSIVGAALTIAFLVIVVSLVTTGAVIGWIPPGGLPIWAVVLIVILAFAVVGGPIGAFRRAAYGVMNGRPHALYHSFDGVVWIALLALGAWMAYLYVPPAHIWFEQAYAWSLQAWDSLQHSWQASSGAAAPASPGTPP